MSSAVYDHAFAIDLTNNCVLLAFRLYDMLSDMSKV